MEGTPADLTTYADGNQLHDHTYYGRGCSNTWGTDGDGGSITPCADSDAGGRYVKTADNETQKNGTYYNFQAATVGTGAAMTTDKSDSPDTLCPLGWQMPYSGTVGDYDDKSRTWNHLFKLYSIRFSNGSSADVDKVNSYPLSYIYAGFFHWSSGRFYHQGSRDYYWSSTLANDTAAYYLDMWPTGVRPSDKLNKLTGSTVRCVNNFCIPYRRHGGRNPCRSNYLC